ncbi:hypothetical protein GUJ93_ZPchr0008g12567 [Zizania palustris]|uniref:Uncharacterized protein n=1 Tax=Zizania palustris TaxID=103762 RepID=A0A8J5RKE8_ZIZPA|nr:hypothetical protein GUJ93_ZPchr0008g12567 [Zizania palustris]
MAAMASSTSPSSSHLLLHCSPSTDTRQLPSKLQLAVAAAAVAEEEAAGVHGEFVAAANALRRGPPRKGKGGQLMTNAVLQVKPRGGARLRRPAPPGGAGPREGRGGSGGDVHAVADSGPKRPSSPAEGTGGSGGVVNATSS